MLAVAIVNSSGRLIALKLEMSQAADESGELSNACHAQLTHRIVQQLRYSRRAQPELVRDLLAGAATRDALRHGTLALRESARIGCIGGVATRDDHAAP